MKVRIVIIFMICILIGFSIVAQAKSTKGMNLFVSRKNITDLEVSIDTTLKEIDDLNAQIHEVRQKYEDYLDDDYLQGKNLYDAVMADLALYKNLTATTAVHGPGVIITLDDSPEDIPSWADTNAYIVHDTDIMRIICDLNKSGAEAISINGHRIYSASTIYCNGYTVRINGEPEARPFIIKAIGDPANLSAAMVSQSSYGSLLKDFFGLVFRVEVESDLTLTGRPSRPVAYRYAQIVRVTEDVQ